MGKSKENAVGLLTDRRASELKKQMPEVDREKAKQSGLGVCVDV